MRILIFGFAFEVADHTSTDARKVEGLLSFVLLEFLFIQTFLLKIKKFAYNLKIKTYEKKSYCPRKHTENYDFFFYLV